MRRLRLAPFLLALALLPLLASSGSARPAATLGFTLIKSGLDQPDYVTAPLNEPTRIYVVQRNGLVLRFENGVQQADPFLDLRTDVSPLNGERGMISIAFDQRYATNHFVYVSYTGKTPAVGDIHVDRFTAVGGLVDVSTRKELLVVPHSASDAHNGGLLTTPADMKLYIALGDGYGTGGDAPNNSQNTSLKLGKLLSLDVSKSSSTWRMLGLGFRNPWRYSFDRETGDLYVGDVGQDQWEEVDVVRAGDSLMNFGWPHYEGTKIFRNGAVLAPYGKLITPVFTYAHNPGGCRGAVTGGYVYRGTAVPLVKGKYVFGDFCNGVVRYGFLAGGKLQAIVAIGQKLPLLTSFGEDAAGELYAVTLTGSLYKLHQ